MNDRTAMSQDATRSRRAILGARTRRLARPRKETPPPPSIACLVCEAGGSLYGVPLVAALRVTPSRNLVPTPSRNPSLVGVYGHSAGFYHVFDLAVVTGAGETAEEGELILLRGGDPHIALRVDKVLDAADLVDATSDVASGMRPAHPILSRYCRPLADRLDGGIVGLLDVAKLWTASESVREGDVRVD